MEIFDKFKKFIIYFDIFIIPLMIYQSIVGSFPTSEWIAIIVLNLGTIIFNKIKNNKDY